MQRLFNYINETGGLAVLGKIDAPPSHYESVADIFQKTYEHEVLITGKINELAKQKKNVTEAPFKFSQHGESGMWISELLPNIARHADDLCVIRSMKGETNTHEHAVSWEVSKFALSREPTARFHFPGYASPPPVEVTSRSAYMRRSAGARNSV